MVDLSCKFLGIELVSPFIIDCSSLPSSYTDIINYEKSSAGAILLKPCFEEKINEELDRLGEILKNLESNGNIKLIPDFYIDRYLQHIINIKGKTTLPVIANINCIASGNWIEFSKAIEWAGADAIELNIFFFPSDKDFRSDDYERIYIEIATKFTYSVQIPVSINLSPNFTNILYMIDNLFYRGIQGISMFSRFCDSDIDLEQIEIIKGNGENYKLQYFDTLRWVRLVSAHIPKIDLAVSSGITDSKSIIKMLLAGAHVVYLGDNIKNRGPEYIKVLINDLIKWFNINGFEKIEHIHGQMNYNHVNSPVSYERQLLIEKYLE